MSRFKTTCVLCEDLKLHVQCCELCHKSVVMDFEERDGKTYYTCCTVSKALGVSPQANRSFAKPLVRMPNPPKLRREPQAELTRLFRLKLRAKGQKAQERAANALARALASPVTHFSSGVSRWDNEDR